MNTQDKDERTVASEGWHERPQGTNQLAGGPRYRYGKKRVSDCQCKYNFTCGPMNRYRNPWHKETIRATKEFYENNAPQVLEHRGVKVFRLFDKAFDFVLGDCAIAQRAGITEAKREIDALLDGQTPTTETVATHLISHGFKPITYDQYTKAWQRGEVA